MATILEKVKKAKQEGVFEHMTYVDLRTYGMQNFNGAIGFSNYKKALAEVGIDFADSKIKHIEALEAQRPEAPETTHSLTLYCDGKSVGGGRPSRYAVTLGDGAALWHGPGDGLSQWASEVDAASKAIWLSGKIRESLNIPAGCLAVTLYSDAVAISGYWEDKSKLWARGLIATMRKAGIVLTIVHVAGTENRADKYTENTRRATGFGVTMYERLHYSEVVPTLIVEDGAITTRKPEPTPAPAPREPKPAPVKPELSPLEAAKAGKFVASAARAEFDFPGIWTEQADGTRRRDLGDGYYLATHSADGWRKQFHRAEVARA